MRLHHATTQQTRAWALASMRNESPASSWDLMRIALLRCIGQGCSNDRKVRHILAIKACKTQESSKLFDRTRWGSIKNLVDPIRLRLPRKRQKSKVGKYATLYANKLPCTDVWLWTIIR